MSLLTIQSGIAQGLMWAILTLGVYLTFRVLDIADLTVEGSFPLGAAICVIAINKGLNPLLAMLLAVICGMLAGLITGFFITVFKIPPILSGILTQIALYSVNIRIMSNKSTVSIMEDSFKEILSAIFKQGLSSNLISIIAGVLVCAVIIFVLYRFFGTELGCAIRATGCNDKMAKALGINTDFMTIFCLMLSNGLVALSGSMIAQFDYGAALVNMGQGTIVIGLASVIIGEVLFIHKEQNFAFKMSAVVFGSVIYRTIIACALTLPWMKATDLKIITAIIVAIALSLPVIKKRVSFAKRVAFEKKMDIKEGKN